MGNTELTKFYLGLNAQLQTMPEVSYYDIIPALDKHFNGQWTWELADEKIILDGTSALTTVTVYIPGKVLTGRSLCKIKDLYTNHLFAIMDACQSFITKREVTFYKGAAPVNEPKSTDPNPYQMTPEQIAAAVNGHVQTTSNEMLQTAVQVDNYKENGMPQDVVPFDKISDQALNEMQPSIEQNNNAQPQQQNNNGQPGYDEPQQKYKGYSQHQMDRMNKFKKDFEIMNDEMFGNFVNSWDNKLMSKRDLTPANVDAFLTWTENLGNMGC